MDLNLRKAIKNNIAGNNEEQLQATIVDAVESGEEKMLQVLAYFLKCSGRAPTKRTKSMYWIF